MLGLILLSELIQNYRYNNCMDLEKIKALCFSLFNANMITVGYDYLNNQVYCEGCGARTEAVDNPVVYDLLDVDHRSNCRIKELMDLVDFKRVVT